MKGTLHPLWKGKKVSYSGLHHWIKRELGIANRCCNKECKYPRLNANGNMMYKPRKFEWANLSKKYKRKTWDFVSLCASCHQKFDLNKINIKI